MIQITIYMKTLPSLEDRCACDNNKRKTKTFRLLFQSTKKWHGMNLTCATWERQERIFWHVYTQRVHGLTKYMTQFQMLFMFGLQNERKSSSASKRQPFVCVCIAFFTFEIFIFHRFSWKFHLRYLVWLSIWFSVAHQTWREKKKMILFFVDVINLLSLKAINISNRSMNKTVNAHFTARRVKSDKM